MPAPIGKSALMLLPGRDFRDEEYLQPRDALERAGASIIVASTTTDEVTGMRGMTVKPDLLVDDADASQFAGFVLVGGTGAAEYFHSEAVHDLARAFAAAGKPLGAICIAPTILANAGLLDGRAATCHDSQSGNLKKRGARYTGRLVERDGNLVTAEGPLAAQQFGRTLVAMLNETRSQA